MAACRLVWVIPITGLMTAIPAIMTVIIMTAITVEAIIAVVRTDVSRTGAAAPVSRMAGRAVQIIPVALLMPEGQAIPADKAVHPVAIIIPGRGVALGISAGKGGHPDPVPHRRRRSVPNRDCGLHPTASAAALITPPDLLTGARTALEDSAAKEAVRC